MLHTTHRRILLSVLVALWAIAARFCVDAIAAEPPFGDERLTFQTHVPWSPRLNVNADVALVYGIDDSLPARIESWRNHGYGIHVMTGVSWGAYADFLEGRFDGHVHDDQGQTEQNGQRIMHGIGHGIYYLCPSDDYAAYLCSGVQRALDSGAEAIHLEEPEFWASAGYSACFKRQWKEYYHENWQPPDASVDAQYRASKLKYVLFQKALSQVFQYVHNYNQTHHRAVRCYVPSHSLLNYAHWRIVSPESSLLNVGCDGFIAQVWTGTSRTPNVYVGQKKERTFETAFLEYGAMQNLVRASGKRVWYLNDPIEDNPDRSWADYRRNWENTQIASLLQTEVWRYEVMPWPERVFLGAYPPDDAALKLPEANRPRVTIPPAYESEIQNVFHALGEMKQPDDRAIRWEKSGPRQIGVLVSDTMMFQRSGPNPSDANLGSFYGLAMPLVKRGALVQPVQMEFADLEGALAPYRMLLLTYEGQKPPSPKLHQALAAWVKAGGALVVVDDDRDPYLAVREWWNSDGNKFHTPREHLFKLLGLPANAEGTIAVGKGVVVRESISPASLSYRADGGDYLRGLLKKVARQIGMPWSECNALVLRRGPYVVVAGLSETGVATEPEHIDGPFINLFDPDLKVLAHYEVQADARALLVDLTAMGAQAPAIVAASCRTRDWHCSPERITLRCDGIERSTAQVVIAIPALPKRITVGGKELKGKDINFADHVLRVRFPNQATVTTVEIDR